MKRETSYGIIPLKILNGKWRILLIQHHAGHWSFPKGHKEPGETDRQAAERELFEEAGLRVLRYLSPDPLTENYFFRMSGDLITKQVHYFLALVKGRVSIQEFEIKASRWFPLPEAHLHLTFKEGQRICQQVCEIVKSFDDHGNPLLAGF